MEPIKIADVQGIITRLARQDVYIHLETTNGAYASHFNEGFFSAGAHIRNAKVNYEHGKIIGDGPYRVGLKIELGWIYAEGLTHYEFDEHGRLLLAGHGGDGKLAVALEISPTPFN
ncbi:YojF family protein [Rossellomorea sp. KS-H15a]|uniref:YojF family protein n=1 Tax=Rossellomorea sp. KS-H15a TaxID=2963940 RepID=UPI0020C6AAF5|nr:YojF family protein [Rossellomorea sp. KS-H15a]UTE77631.1 YojF family protein [Rossellomorea sp. KS-H15a]